MYCPDCSQQVLDDRKFCPKCGLALDAVKRLLADKTSPQGGQTLTQPRGLTACQKGVRQGFQLILLSLILIPAYVLLAALFPADDLLVESSPSDTAFEKISQAVLVTLFMCGLARIAYAYLFERSHMENAPGQINHGADKLLFSSVTSIESEGLKTGELIDSDTSREQPPERLNRR